MKRVSLHILFWTLYLAQDTAFAYLADAGVLSHFSTSARIVIALKVCVGLLLPKIVLTYFLLYVMLERIIKQREKLAMSIFYTVLVFTVILLIYRILEVYIIYPFTYEGIRPAGNYFNGASFLFGLMDLGFVSGTAIAIKVIKLQLIAKEKEKLLIKDKLETELKFLKNQTNPHFLFNTLNNIYSFALTSSPKSPQMLLRLSEILSYTLYECNDGRVPLEKEIKMLKDYMMLEQIRYGDKLEMNMQVKGDTGHQMIAPLLLLNFIENSFRQCNDTKMEQLWINLEIIIQDGIFFMQLLNGKSVALASNTEDDEHLVQVKKRLQLLYPGKYKLKIVEEPEIFILKLEIELAGAFKTAEGKASLSKRKHPSLSFI